MDAVLLIDRLVIAGVLAVAGLTKLFDIAGAREALEAFGVPRSLTRPLARALPLAEIAVAGFLLPTRTVWWGAVGALTLFLLFAAAVAVNLVRGRRPHCRCFGQLSNAAVGWGTVSRNLALGAAALVVVAGPTPAGPSVPDWLSDLTAAQQLMVGAAVIAIALVATTTWFALQVLRQQGRMLLRLEALEQPNTGARAPIDVTNAAASRSATAAGLPVGSPAPDFSVADLDGRLRSLEELSALAASTLLLFVDTECGPCTALLPDATAWRYANPERMRVVIISRGAVDANRDKFAAHGLDPILLEQNFEISTSYRAYGTPSAVVVSAERTIGSPVAAGADAIRALVGRTLGQILRPRSGQGHLERANDHRHPPAGVPLGDQAPHVSVTSLDGRRVRIEAARERPTVVLFWNPTCGFCQAMRSDILAWETAAPQGGPALIVVSSGSVEQCRNERFRGSVLIDSDFIAGRSFGASGTPSAVLLDQDGRVASRVVVGREAVLALLQPPTSTSYSASAGVTRGVGTESAMNR